MSQQLSQFVTDLQQLVNAAQSITTEIWQNLTKLLQDCCKHNNNTNLYDTNDIAVLLSVLNITNEHCTNDKLHTNIIKYAVQLLQQIIKSDSIIYNDNVRTQIVSTSLATLCHNNVHTNVQQLEKLLIALLHNTPYTQYPNHTSLRSIDTIVSQLVQYESNELINALYVPYLSVICQLARHNVTIKSNIKQHTHIKQLYSVLIKQLSSTTVHNVLYSLSLLAILAVNDSIETKLFKPSNINSTLQLVFNLILNGTTNITEHNGTTNGHSKTNTINEHVLQASVDLLHDLLQSVHIMTSLTSYTHLQPTFQRVLALCKVQFKHHITTPNHSKTVSILLDLLSLLLRQTTLQSQLMPLLLESQLTAMLLTLSFDTIAINAVKSIQLLQYIQQHTNNQLNGYLLSDSPFNTLLSLLKPEHINAAIESDYNYNTNSTQYAYSQVIANACTLIQQLIRSDADVLERTRKHIDYNSIINILSNMSTQSDTAVQLYISLVALLITTHSHITAVKAYCNVIFTDATVSQLFIKALNSQSIDTIQSTLYLLAYANNTSSDTLSTLSENMCNASKLHNNDTTQQSQTTAVIQAANEQLQQQLQQCYDELSQYKSVTQHKHNEYEKQIARLQTELHTYDQSKQSEINQVINQHTTELTALTQKLHSSDSKIIEQQNTITKLQFDTTHANNQYNALQSQYKELQQRNKLLETKSNKLITNIATLNKQVTQLQQQHKTELQTYKEKQNATQSQIDTIKQQYEQKYAEQAQKLEDTFGQLIKLAQVYEHLESQHNTLQQTHKTEQRQHVERCNTLQRQVDTLQSSNHDIQVLNTQLQAQCNSHLATTLQQQSTIQQLESDIVDLQSLNVDAQTTISQLQQQLQQLTQQYNTATEELQRHAALITLIHSLSNNNTTRTANVQQLTNQIAQLQSVT